MSVLDDVRSYAEIALEQGKTIAGQAQARLGSVSGEAREHANVASEDAKRFAETLAEVARKQAFALLGAGDLAVTAVTKRGEGLSAEARSNRGVTRSEPLASRLQQRFAVLCIGAERVIGDRDPDPV